MLYFRVATEGMGRMPQPGHWGTDPEGLRVLREWIESLEPPEDGGSPAGRGSEEASVLDALEFQARLDDGEVQLSEARDRIEEFLNHGPPETAGLFLRFLDPAERPEQVGPRPNRGAILHLAGDPEAGAALFDTKAAGCLACHRIGGRGNPWGPGLTGRRAGVTKEGLLESLIDPSAVIAPEYRLETVEARGEGTLSGFVRGEDERELQLHVLGEAKPVSVAKSSIVSRVTSSQSAMPPGLVSGFTPQEVADLIAFLVERVETAPGKAL